MGSEVFPGLLAAIGAYELHAASSREEGLLRTQVSPKRCLQELKHDWQVQLPLFSWEELRCYSKGC